MEYSYGAKNKGKTRFIADIVTPAKPQYLYGKVDEAASERSRDFIPPILGISYAVGGYKVLIMNRTEQAYC